jgi:hypothetical protein
MTRSEVPPVEEAVTAPPKSASGKKPLRTAVVALSLSNLCLMPAWFASLFDKDYGYFNKLPVSSQTMLAMLANFLLLTLVFWIAARFVQRSRNRFVIIGADLLLFAILLIPLDFIRANVLQIHENRAPQLLTNSFGIAALVIVAAGLLRWRRRAAHLGSTLLVVLSPLALLTLARTVMVLLGFRVIAQDAGLPRELAPLIPSTNSTRVVWIIFDELDYRFAFVDRPREARLPELDRLSRESFSAARAYPPAGETLLSIPSLTIGQRVSRALPRGASDLSLQVDGSGTNLTSWHRFPTVFSDARQVGRNAAIVGWYHPYERLFDSSVSFCSWHPAPWYEPGRESAFLGTLNRELCSMISPLNLRFLQLRLFEQTFSTSRTLVTNRNFGLVFLHLPVPHRPGIYQPEQKKLTFTGVLGQRGYLGNLLLADHVLGVLRRDMELAHVWDSTWVIVSSDHWWRESMGNIGTIDHRVPFIIKAPAAQSVTYGAAFNTMVSRDLILAMLKGELATGDQLAPWLDDHHSEPPENYNTQNDTE